MIHIIIIVFLSINANTSIAICITLYAMEKLKVIVNVQHPNAKETSIIGSVFQRH
jgi:hypothetical protein